ncbi:MAG: BatA domain-containing protein [Planctomycetota bacterium]
MQFLYQPLTWGFVLVLVPLAIQLINLMRQRRVEWAAMEFLLKAHRKHRKWIWLRQMLLLATRMLVIAAIVAMLAHLVTRRQWTSLFGNQTTHHFVLLDDSYSMSDEIGGASSFDRAVRAIGEFTNRLMASDVSHKLTLIRWSQAELASNATPTEQDETPVETEELTAVDLNALSMGPEAEQRLAEIRGELVVSATSASPLAAMEYASQLIEQSPEETSIVHVLSDFRRQDWQQAEETRDRLKQLDTLASELQLIDCAESQHDNLAITDLQPMPGTLAAGVPIQLTIEVRNHGKQPARQVPVAIRTTTAGASQPNEDIPALLIEEIPAGEAVTREAQVFFPIAGQHVIHARLPEDAVAADNERWCVLELPDQVPVLVIDGDVEQRNAAYFRTVFQPSDRVSTGVDPDVRDVSFLASADAETLAAYHAVYLMDVPRLDPLVRSNLQRYVRDGGGVAIFLGPNVDWNAYDEAYEAGQGLLPVRLTSPRLLNSSNDQAGLVATDHPSLRVIAGDDNPFASSIRFSRYFGVPASDLTSDVEVIARLGIGQPLIVETRLGSGRVVMMLSTLAPTWNNWATQPSFVVFLLELQSYLDSLQENDRTEQVNAPIEFAWDVKRFAPELRLTSPMVGLDNGITLRSEELAANAGTPPTESASNPNGDSALVTVAGPGLGSQRSTARPGIYEITAQRLDGTRVAQRFALNVDPEEGALELYDRGQFSEQLGRDVSVVAASDVALDEGTDDRFSWSQLLLLLLPLLLLAELILAYRSSYHPKARDSIMRRSVQTAGSKFRRVA